MGGGGNNGWEMLTNPVSIILPKKYSFFADPIHNFTAQQLQNYYDVLSGRSSIAQHKDWLGNGGGGGLNKKLRRWNEGKNYKKWETWQQEQALEYERQYAELRERNKQKHNNNNNNNNNNNPSTPAATTAPTTSKPTTTTTPARKAPPQKTTLLDDEAYRQTSYLK